MRRYTSSELTNKRAEVIEEAKRSGVIIECRKTNGEVVDELVLISKSILDEFQEMKRKAYEMQCRRNSGQVGR